MGCTSVPLDQRQLNLTGLLLVDRSAASLYAILVAALMRMQMVQNWIEQKRLKHIIKFRLAAALVFSAC